ncbi:MAG: NADAR family protein [Alkaliphilus sp.]|nr:NADAR family protein [Alkaliphilus sp.]
MNIINSFKGEYHWLSNFSPFSFKDENGKEWKTVEHYYQAHKTLDNNERNKIWMAKDPKEAKKLGRNVKIRDDWEIDGKLICMIKAVNYKFEQNRNLIYRLINTGDSILIEGNRWHDNFWGNCYCQKCKSIQGQNKLGKILMLIRKRYKKRYNK